MLFNHSNKGFITNITKKNISNKNLNKSSLSNHNFNVKNTVPFTHLSNNVNVSIIITSYITSIINKPFSNNTCKNKGIKISFIRSKPNITYNNNKNTVIIQIYFYTNINKKSFNKPFLIINKILEILYNKKVNLIIIRINYPYINRDIFAKYLVYNSSRWTFINFKDHINKKIKFSNNNNKLPFFITGIKIQIHGRLITEYIIPRITKKSYIIGKFSQSDIKIDSSKYTFKNKLGSFTINVWISILSALIIYYLILCYLILSYLL